MGGRSKSAERTALRFRRPSEHHPPTHYGSAQGGSIVAPTKPLRSVSIASPPTDLDRLNLHQGGSNEGNWHHVYKDYKDNQDVSGHMYRY